MATPRITISGRVAVEPELKFSQAGKAMGRLRIVASDRKKNDAGEWIDGDQTWLSVKVWSKLAENAVESLKVGDLVIVTGRLVTETWTAQDGGKRSAVVLNADDIGASLQFRTLIGHGRVHEERARAVGAGEQDPWKADVAEQPDTVPPFF